jgi:DNA-binding transcriptional LysR family regulator
MYPRVNFGITVEPSQTICEQVRAGAVDCGLIEAAPEAGLVSVLVASDELVLVCAASHPLASLKRVTSEDLAQHRYVGRGQLWSAEGQARDMIGDAYDRSAMLNLGHPEYVRAATLAGLGYSVLPVRAVILDLESGRLVRLPVPTKNRDITAVRRAAAGAPPLEEFWHLVETEVQTAARR